VSRALRRRYGRTAGARSARYEVRDVSGVVLYRTLRRQYAIARARELAGERLPFGRGGSFVRGAAFVYAPDGRYVARADWRPGGHVDVEIGRST
jgi:hypothetical protein